MATKRAKLSPAAFLELLIIFHCEQGVLCCRANSNVIPLLARKASVGPRPRARRGWGYQRQLAERRVNDMLYRLSVIKSCAAI